MFCRSLQKKLNWNRRKYLSSFPVSHEGASPKRVRTEQPGEVRLLGLLVLSELQPGSVLDGFEERQTLSTAACLFVVDGMWLVALAKNGSSLVDYKDIMLLVLVACHIEKADAAVFSRKDVIIITTLTEKQNNRPN